MSTSQKSLQSSKPVPPQPPPPLAPMDPPVAVEEVPSQGPQPLAKVTEQRPEVVSPQSQNLQKLLDKFYGTGSSSKWDKSKRRCFRSLTFHTFLGATTSGVTLYILCSIWFMLFTHAKVVYTFPLATAGTPKTIDVKSPFLSEVKYGLETFSYYSSGCIVMIIGGMCAYYTMTSPYHTRAFRYFADSLFFLLSALALIAGPVIALIAKNTKAEAKLLDRDSGLAYERSIHGSIEYFQNRQCDIIGKAVLGRELKEADEMRAFCSLISRLVYIYYFMAATSIVPLLAAIMCWLQIAINCKEWNAKAMRRPKPRTNEQKQEDQCLKD